MIDFSLILENDIVRLRPLVYEDFDSFLPICREPEMWSWFTSDLSDLVALENWVKEAVTAIKNKSRLAFTIIDKSDNQIIGSTSLGNYSKRDSRIEIGWTWLAKAIQGRQINDHSKLLLMNYCFEKLKLQRVELKTDVLNTHARNAMKRMGFSEEGILRSHTLRSHGRRRDTIFYSVLLKEWPEIKKRLMQQILK